jgi:hypothetical protein
MDHHALASADVGGGFELALHKISLSHLNVGLMMGSAGDLQQPQITMGIRFIQNKGWTPFDS